MTTENLDIRALLRSSGQAVGTYPIVVFVPGTDVNGASIDQGFWISEWLQHLAQSFRGATAFPPGRGAWRRPDGAILLEETSLILTMAAPDDVTEESMSALGAMARKFGQEANQGEVGLWINGAYYPIIDFEKK